jgi:predicted metal-dependent phosphoesterase TrpH
MKFADLHVHTHYSDSTFSPQQVVIQANSIGLSAVGICDHDSIDGIASSIRIAKKYEIEIVPGIELTAENDDSEIHILGYFLDWKAAWLKKTLKAMQKDRVKRIRVMVKKLAEHGIVVRAGDIYAGAGKGSVGRLHVAKVLVNSGLVKSYREVFAKYIGFGKPCYVPHLRYSPKESIELLLKAGAVPVLAHPGTLGKDDCIPELVSCGLRGIEAYHTDQTQSQSKHYEKLAEEHGLIVTGGSDCHGMGKGRILMGGVRVGYEVVEKLKAESERIRRG